MLIATFHTPDYLQVFGDVCPEAEQAEPAYIDSWRFPHLRSVTLIGHEHDLRGRP